MQFNARQTTLRMAHKLPFLELRPAKKDFFIYLFRPATFVLVWMLFDFESCACCVSVWAIWRLDVWFPFQCYKFVAALALFSCFPALLFRYYAYAPGARLSWWVALPSPGIDFYVCLSPLPRHIPWFPLFGLLCITCICFSRTFLYFPLVFNGISSLVYFPGMRARPDAQR